MAIAVAVAFYGAILLDSQQFVWLMAAAAIGLGLLFYFLRPKKNYEKQMGFLKKLRGKKSNDSHGSAEFCNSRDIKKADLNGDKGFILGKFNEKFIRFKIPGHLITFAPTRSGKGVGHVIPNLLDHPGSVVC